MLARSTSSRKRRASRSAASSPQRSQTRSSLKSSIAHAAAATLAANSDIGEPPARSRRASMSSTDSGSVAMFMTNRSPRNSIAVPQTSETNLLSVSGRSARCSFSVANDGDPLQSKQSEFGGSRSARGSFADGLADPLLAPGSRSARCSISVPDIDKPVPGSRSARGSFAVPEGSNSLLLPPQGTRSARGSFSCPNSEIEISVPGSRSARASFSVPSDNDEALLPMNRSPRASFAVPVDRTPRGSLIPPEVGSSGLGPRSSLVPETGRNSRASICGDIGKGNRAAVIPEVTRSPRGSLSQESNRTPRGSIIPEHSKSPRGSIGPEVSRSPRGSLGPDGLPLRSPRSSPRGSLPDTSSLRGGTAGTSFHGSPRGSVDISGTQKGGLTVASSGSYRMSARGVFGNHIDSDSRRASSSVSQASVDDKKQLCEHTKLNPDDRTGLRVYGSVVYQLKDANIEASGACDFVLRALRIVFKTVTITIILVCLTALPIIMLIMVFFSGLLNISAQRLNCPRDSFGKWPQNRVNTTQRLIWLRTAMSRNSSIREPVVDAYIITSDDEHQSEFTSDRDKRLQYISGFSGKGIAAVTKTEAALWTTERYYGLADQQLNCKWTLMKQGEPRVPSVTEWLGRVLGKGYRVGADPKTVPNAMWMEWSRELEIKRIPLVEKSNLIDSIWTIDRPEYVIRKNSTYVIPTEYAGDTWQNKVTMLRQNLTRLDCDAIIVTALEEIAWLLNIRGRDTPFNNFVRSYLIVTQNEIYWFVAREKISEGVRRYLKINYFGPHSVRLKDYELIEVEIRTLSQLWRKVLIPTTCVYSAGASQAIYASVPPEKRFTWQSPIIFMKAKKNPTEVAGMRRANIRDAAVVVDFLAFVDNQRKNKTLTEMYVAKNLEMFRLSQNMSVGDAFPTVAAFGPNAGLSYYVPTNTTDREINDQSTLIIESGGHYYDGTSDFARTFHFGRPSQVMIDAYTNLLKGLIEFSSSKFLSSVKTSDIDMIIRSTLWRSGINYKMETGHGVGAFSTIKESPITINYDYKHQRQSLREGHFITCEPAYHSPNYFGVKLGNMLEVVPVQQRDNTSRYLKFNDVTLLPFSTKLIDEGALTEYEVDWINRYHLKVRQTVGAELKRQKRMQGFYWLMEKTKEISYVCRSAASSTNPLSNRLGILFLVCLMYFGLG